MVSLTGIRMIVGFGFKGLGFFWTFSDKFICGPICGGTCSAAQSSTCSFLLLFVGIIFIVSGYALIVMKDKERKSLRQKIKKNLYVFKR